MYKENIRDFYYEGIWKDIESDKNYTLGKREVEALIRFLPTVAKHVIKDHSVLHLAAGTGREAPHLLYHLPGLDTYFLNDICKPVVERTFHYLSAQFPSTTFLYQAGNIEQQGFIRSLRTRLTHPTLISLVANGVIFSNRNMDYNIHKAMNPKDQFLLTIESPHGHMYESYQIEPVLRLLSESGINVTNENAEFCYDETDQCMKISCEGKVLLSSYKPNPDQLRGRMTKAGFAEVVLEEYPNLHMIGSLWKTSQTSPLQ